MSTANARHRTAIELLKNAAGGARMVCHDVEVTADMQAIAKALAEKAARSKRGVATALNRTIVVRAEARKGQ